MRFLSLNILACTVAFSSALMVSASPAGAVSVLPQSGYVPAFHAISAIKDREKGAEAFVGSMAKRALDFLGNTQQTQAQKTESFRKLLEDNFDMETIGRFTLGTYWRTATPAQRTEYQRLFRKRVVEIYSQRFSEYKGQKFETAGARPEGDTDSVVRSFIIPQDGGPRVLVEWRVRHRDGRYRIVDVLVEGVSMSVTQRSDFASIIQRGGGDIQVLLDHLKNG
jgi:phospholipid transport system substrate-binding protein